MAKRIPPSKKMEQELYTDLVTSSDPLGEAARRGARLILQKAIETEIDQFLGRGWYERSGDGATSGHRATATSARRCTLVRGRSSWRCRNFATRSCRSSRSGSRRSASAPSDCWR
jgi:hypothetical protein